MPVTMTPQHPRWRVFADRLGGMCEFKDDGTWTCPGDFSFARQILAEMGCDVERSLDHFEQHGGFCDCEVLFNLDTGPDDPGGGGEDLPELDRAA